MGRYWADGCGHFTGSTRFSGGIMGRGKGENAREAHLAQQLLSEDVSVWWASGQRGGPRARFGLSSLFLGA